MFIKRTAKRVPSGSAKRSWRVLLSESWQVTSPTAYFMTLVALKMKSKILWLLFSFFLTSIWQKCRKKSLACFVLSKERFIRLKE